MPGSTTDIAPTLANVIGIQQALTDLDGQYLDLGRAGLVACARR
jgi:hypothetical protein